MTKINKNILLLTASGILTLLLFQNCAKEVDVDQYGTNSPSTVNNDPNPPAPVNKAPVITNAPTGTLNYAYMAPMALTVQATGIDLTYAWYRNNVLITGANTNTLSVASLNQEGTFSYRVLVQNGYGSADAVITVKVTRAANQFPPSISTHLQNQRVTVVINSSGVFMGANNPNNNYTNRVVFSVTASNAASYEWFFINSVGVEGKITGASGPTFTLDVLPNNYLLLPGKYKVKITNSYGIAESTADLSYEYQFYMEPPTF